MYTVPTDFPCKCNQQGLIAGMHGTKSSLRLRLKCDGTRAETTFRLSVKWTSPLKSAGWRHFNRQHSAVVMLDTPCSEVV